MNQKFHNDEWVDRLTWRLYKLVKLIKTDNPEVKAKAVAILRSLFWSKNIRHYKVSSGIIP